MAPAIEHEHGLVLTRLIDAPSERLFRAWTERAFLAQRFAPHPWTTPKAETDVRPGGSSKIVMPLHGSARSTRR